MAVMIMEALDGFDRKYSWSIVGHSGDGPAVPLVSYGDPPADRGRRLKVIQVNLTLGEKVLEKLFHAALDAKKRVAVSE
jgi:hypothetical protein